MSIKVLIADDHPVLRYGLTAYLERQPDIRVVGEADGGDQVLPVIASAHPDVLLLDVNMPGMDTWHILAALPDLESPPQVLIFTAYSDPDKVMGLVRAGARGYLLKGAPKAEILRAIRGVINGEAIFGPAIAKRLMQFFAATQPAVPARLFPELTGREREILALIAQHYTNPEVGERLTLSPKTVRNHVSNIFAKLQVADRAEAILKARDAGLK